MKIRLSVIKIVAVMGVMAFGLGSVCGAKTPFYVPNHEDFRTKDIKEVITNSKRFIYEVQNRMIKEQGSKLKQEAKGFTGREGATDRQYRDLEYRANAYQLAKQRLDNKYRAYEQLCNTIRIGLWMNFFSANAKMELREELWQAFIRYRDELKGMSGKRKSHSWY